MEFQNFVDFFLLRIISNGVASVIDFPVPDAWVFLVWSLDMLRLPEKDIARQTAGRALESESAGDG